MSVVSIASRLELGDGPLGRVIVLARVRVPEDIVNAFSDAVPLSTHSVWRCSESVSPARVTAAVRLCGCESRRVYVRERDCVVGFCRRCWGLYRARRVSV